MVFTETHQSAGQLCLDSLMEEIGLLRYRLNQMGKDLANLSNPRLVEISQLLDQKLNDYEQLKNIST